MNYDSSAHLSEHYVSRVWETFWYTKLSSWLLFKYNSGSFWPLLCCQRKELCYISICSFHCHKFCV